MEDLPLDFDAPMAKATGVTDATGLPHSMAKSSGVGSSFYSAANGDIHRYGSQSPSAAVMGSPKHNKSRKSNPSGEQASPFHSNYNPHGNGIPDGGVLYPSVHT